MARTVTLLQLRTDISAQCDFSTSVTGRYTPTLLNRIINQSIQRFRERISNEGMTHFLVSASGTLSQGTTDPYAFQTLDLSSLNPSLVRTYGVDITIAGVVKSLAHRPFTERNDFSAGLGAQMVGTPIAWAHFQTRSIAIMPGPDGDFPYTVWYLPVLPDLVSDGDTFDGVAGWEVWVLWDCVCQLIARDQYAAAYAQAIAERDLAWQDIVRSATKVSAAGGAVVGRDSFGQAGLWGAGKSRIVQATAGGNNLPSQSSITNAMLVNRNGPIVLGRLPATTGQVEDVPVASLTSHLSVFAGGKPGLVPSGPGDPAQMLRGDGSFAAPTGLGPSSFGLAAGPVVIGRTSVATGAVAHVPVPSLTPHLQAFSGAHPGTVPTGTSNALDVLHGDATWRPPLQYDVRYYGAVGDGISDDTAAINAAIAAAIASGGGTVYFGRVHKITSALNTITGCNNVYLVGRGGNNQGTRLVLSGSDNINWINFLSVQSCGISGVYIQRAQIASATPAGYAVTFNNCFGCRARDIWFSQTENGIKIFTCTDTVVDDCKVRDMFGSRGVFVGGSGAYGNQTLVRELRTDMGYPAGYPAAFGSGMAMAWIANEAVPSGAIRIVSSVLNWQCTSGGNAGATNATLTSLPSTDPTLARSTAVANGTAQFKYVGRADSAWLNLDSFGGDLEVVNSALLNGGMGLYMSDNGVPGFQSSIVRVTDLAVDHPLDDCVLLEKGADVMIQGWFSSSLRGRGVNVAGNFGQDWSIHDSRVFGCAKDGVLINNGGNGALTGNRIGYNSQSVSGTYHGVAIAVNAGRFRVNDNHIGETNGAASGTMPQGYGIVALGSNAHYSIVGNFVLGNQLGQIAHPSGVGAQVSANVVT